MNDKYESFCLKLLVIIWGMFAVAGWCSILSGCALTDWLSDKLADPIVQMASSDIVEAVPEALSNPWSPSGWMKVAGAIVALGTAIWGTKKAINRSRTKILK
jgi:hypothetical protein